MKVVLIGSGNVAQVFARLIDQTNHDLAGIICRNASAWDRVWDYLERVPIYRFDDKAPEADIYIAAVSDRFLPDLSHLLSLPRAIVVHTAGSLPAGILAPLSPHYGVLYPLQSLRKENPLLPAIPLLVDGSDADTVSAIELFARSLSGTVARANDELRQKMHIAAVSSSNFMNHLLTLVYEYCKTENLDYRWLLPLWTETIHRLENTEPARVQTGPAIRNDEETIRHHIEKLRYYPQLQSLYRIFSESIRNYHNRSGGGYGPG